MLVLSRKKDQSIMIGDNIVVTVVGIHGDKIRLGVVAPAEIPVHREEVYDVIKKEGREKRVVDHATKLAAKGMKELREADERKREEREERS